MVLEGIEYFISLGLLIAFMLFWQLEEIQWVLNTMVFATLLALESELLNIPGIRMATVLQALALLC